MNNTIFMIYGRPRDPDFPSAASAAELKVWENGQDPYPNLHLSNEGLQQEISDRFDPQAK